MGTKDFDAGPRLTSPIDFDVSTCQMELFTVEDSDVALLTNAYPQS